MNVMMKRNLKVSRWAAAIAAVLAAASQALGLDGTWVNSANGSWSTLGNWAGDTVADGTNAVADFSTLNLTAHAFVNNDAARTVGTIRFGDTTPSHNWTLTNSTLTLAVSSGTPTITVSNQTATVSVGLQGVQGLVKNGAGTLTLDSFQKTDAGNTYSGGTYVLAGTLRYGASGANYVANKLGTGPVYLGDTNGSANVVLGQIYDSDILANNIVLQSGNSGTITIQGSGGNDRFDGTVTLGSPNSSGKGLTVTGGNLTLSFLGVIRDPAGLTPGTAGQVTIAGSPVLFSGNNSYSGGTVINSGSLKLGHISALGSGGLTVNGGVVDLNAKTVIVSALSGTGGIITDAGAAGTTTLIVSQSVTTAYSGVISNGATRAIALTVRGGGALSLSGNNTYTGATLVRVGSKLVGVTGGACGNSVVTVQDGATNGVRVASAGGQWSCAGLTHNAGATALDFDFGTVPPSGSIAPLQVNGNLALNGTAGFVIRNGTWFSTGTYPLVSYTGTLSGSVPSAPVELPAGLSATLVNNTTDKRIDLAVTALPVFVASSVSAWTNLVSGDASGMWGAAANWSNGIPNGVDAVADFTAPDITAHSTVTNEAPRTVGMLRFGDIAPSSTWLVDGGLNNHLTLSTSAGTPEINVTEEGQAMIGGLSGTRGFVKSGKGVLALYGMNYNNSVTGPILVNAGLLSTVNHEAFKGITGDVIVAPGACFQANAYFDSTPFTNNIFLSGSGISVPPSGYLGYVPTPDGLFLFNPAPFGALDLFANVYLSGTITLNADAKITHGYNNATLKGKIVADAPGKNLELAITSYGGPSYPLWVDGGIQLGTGVLTVNSVQGGGAGFAPYTTILFGVDISSANTSSGGTVLTNYATVRLSHPAALGSGGLSLYGDSILNLNANSVTIPWLKGAGGVISDGSASAGTTTLTVSQSSVTDFAGTISNGATRVIALVKTGAGSLTLSGTNTYVGATIISNGTLGVKGALASSSVTVCPGASFAAGGTGVVGRASVAGALTFQNNSNLSVDLAASAADAVTVAGAVVVGSGVSLSVSGDQERAGTWKLVDAVGTVSGSFTLVGGKRGATLTQTAHEVWLTIPPMGTQLRIL